MIIRATILAIFTSLYLGLTALGSTSYAVEDVKIRDDGRVQSVTKPENIKDVGEGKIIDNILNGVYAVIGSIAVLIIVICGIMIITSDGDSQKVATARRGIIYALIGLLIIFSAFIITGVVLGLGK